jgi:hypothetical protein
MQRSAICLILLVFAWWGGALKKQKLGAEQADAFGTMLSSNLRLSRVANIRPYPHSAAIRQPPGLIAECQPTALVGGALASGALAVGIALSVGWGGNQQGVTAINNEVGSVGNSQRRSAQAHHCGNT